ncbi:MAG: 6-pyruvoyl tetrahydrobiopterin synthase [Bacteroidetes bacterium 4484_276]|nr:MAG: 6-pyruvoyl tetrahydrobiopterin synthase [Bacteroidetes bacterium 4484_276]
MKVTTCRKAHFNATHRLHNPNWTGEKNELVFGTCNNPNYHGHNYNLTVKVKGEVDPETGYVMDLKILKEIIDGHIVKRYDHKNLFLDVEDFRDINPSAENIAIKIWNILRKQIDEKYGLKVVLYETERNFVEYDGG